MLGADQPVHWVILLILAGLLFGGYKKLPEMARSAGRSMRVFKTELKGMADDDQARANGTPQTDATGQAGAAVPFPPIAAAPAWPPAAPAPQAAPAAQYPAPAVQYPAPAQQPAPAAQYPAPAQYAAPAVAAEPVPVPGVGTAPVPAAAPAWDPTTPPSA